MRLSVIIVVCFSLFHSSCAIAQAIRHLRQWGTWQNWGDTGNGSYANPVLPADYSDIDCIRVGAEYYAISSTFQFSPGIVIVHSKDLVNWEIAGHAINDITEITRELSWKKMDRYGRGIWAGSIRYHNGKFWIYFGTPDEGYFMTTARKAAGPWEHLQRVMAGPGWDDCCPFWDDDGQGYLIGTHFSDGYSIHLYKMTGDGTALIKGWDKIIRRGRGREANKLYKINSKYYHLFSEEKPGGRALMMEWSKAIAGPYSEPRQLSLPQKQYNEPNQGGLVQTQNKRWYFLTHHGTGDWSGRVVSLLPVTWIDGWPIIGKPTPGNIGEMVWNGKIPVKTTKIGPIQSSDEFDEANLSPQWEWNYQPRADKWSLSERKGWLRLYAFQPLGKNNLLKAGNTITQRSFRTNRNVVITRLDISKMADGEKAGLAHFGYPVYCAFGLHCTGTTKRLELITAKSVVPGAEIHGDCLWLKSAWGLTGKSWFYYSTDGKHFIKFNNSYQMIWEAYRGDRLAIYNYNNKGAQGYVDVDFFRYSYGKN